MIKIASVFIAIEMADLISNPCMLFDNKPSMEFATNSEMPFPIM